MEKKERNERTEFMKKNIHCEKVDYTKPYVFVSYASANWRTVFEKIVVKLHEKGLRVYCDNDFETNNDSWLNNVNKHLMDSKCHAVLAFFSKEYILSYATMIELLISQDDNTVGYHWIDGERTPLEIIPIFTENASSMGTYLEQAVDSFQEKCKIQKTEWDQIVKCIENGFTKSKIDNKELNIKDLQDLDKKRVATWFDDNKGIIAKNINYYDENDQNFISNLIKTIESVDQKYGQSKGSVFAEKDEIKEWFSNSEDDSVIDFDETEFEDIDFNENETEFEDIDFNENETEFEDIDFNEDVTEGNGLDIQDDASNDPFGFCVREDDGGNNPFGFGVSQSDGGNDPFGFTVEQDSFNEDTTLAEFEKICENVNFCMELRKVRKDKTVTAQLFDYFMASLLGGCDSPAMKKEDILRKAVYNYCKYAVAKDCDPNTVGFGASQWTWSSNARKAVRPEDRPADYYDANGNFKGSGKLGANSDIFEKLPRNLTIGDVLKKYENREVGFNTKDNEMIFRSWELIKGLSNR
ncbi:toll/interleukin-1 receptor domain-containing protein [[Clostridium] aminophilum]|uniref:TIR domain-containing protein n=1 Tax=[Clostridium] aminophilum TaxID=1526 RepID=A0A1I6J3S2_9FIRM|nr:toll/interleukin-1 receptor domain-containing protein [[Clostridium] aminophilum]SFR73606.1 TIR domain-containing protein [[Clostridium] aminophilum]